jgi:replicative DNA helicase
MVQSIDDFRRRQQNPAPTGNSQGSGSLRLLPHNLEAEESLLGAMLLSREAIASGAEICNSADFYRPAHGHIFDAILSLYAQASPADPVTVAEELSRNGLLEMIGGSSALVSLQAGTPTITNAAHYARIVEEHSLLRRLISVAGEISEIGYSLPEDITSAVDRAEAMMFDVAQRRTADTMMPLRELLGQNLDRLEMLYERGESITGVPSGYFDLDEQLNGLQPNALYIVGARPAMGKSAFALGMAAHAALEQKRPVLFFSLEMSHLELTQRLLCADAKVDSLRMRNGKLQADDWPKITNAVARLADAPIYIDDNPRLTIMEIRGKARRLKAKAGDLGLIVIDYLQLMNGSSKAENRQVEIAEISRGLKILARELEVPVVALSQLSRTLESRADKRPMLSDLRESGSLEQDADVVMFLYRDEVYNSDSPDRGTAEIIVAKHRSGPVGTTRLAFLDHYTKFANMARTS